jgi:3-hydroxyisobutyrate dehydrogenase-like beta-hydroxyacid dehydrogenase
MHVGFIGLGTMGAGMASNLQKAGHTLVVHDVRRQNAGVHLQAGARWADTPKAVAEACEVVFLSLPGPPEVEAVALGKDGLLEGVKRGSACFDLTTNSPTLVRRLEKAFAERGAYLLDAPVSGGPHGAKSGRLAIWVGGDRETYDKYKAVLDAIGDAARYIGPIGAGSVAKLVHNCAGYAIQAALAEVFALGVKGGVEPLALWEAVRTALRPLPAQQVRPAGLRAQARAQGHAARNRARPRARRAHAARQPRLRRDDGSAQPRLGEPRQPLAHAAPARALRPRGRGRSQAHPGGAGPRSPVRRRRTQTRVMPPLQ